MNKIITFITSILLCSLLAISLQVSAACSEPRYSRQQIVRQRSGHDFHCSSPSLRQVLHRIASFPPGRDFLEKVKQTGRISIRFEPIGKQAAEALWDDDAHAVVLNSDLPSTEGQRIVRIIFELHNALTTDEFSSIVAKAYAGHLTKDKYVRMVEEHEHRNAIAASALLKQGVEAGAYPKDANWKIIRNFEDHYRMQQLMDHSFWIARQYDTFFKNRRGNCRFHGTINGLSQLSPKDKDCMLQYLIAKQSLDEGSAAEKQEALFFLQKEFSSALAKNGSHKLRLLREILGENSPYEKRILDKHYYAKRESISPSRAS